jgi:dihydrolipoamide dehydrogenase
MTEMRCDVAIIGGGTAGLAAERAARKAGAKTLLIDDGFSATTCATVGCMPSKLLIAAANATHRVRQATTFGIRTSSPIVDGLAVMNRLRKERDAFVAATLKTVEQIPSGIRVEGKARFIDRTTLALSDGKSVFAKAIVIATGARPSVPKTFEVLGDMVLTNETIFELRSLPRSIAVVGAGPLGLELAQALARLDVDTEVFEQSDHLAALHDAEVVKELRSILTTEFRIHSGLTLEVARDGDAARVSWSGSSPGARSFDRVLIATGRPPQLQDLNLASAGVSMDKRGVPHFDSTTLQCGKAPIFLAGDADGQRPVLHEAALEGTIAGRNAAVFPNVQRAKRAVPLSIMFTDPPLARIGTPPSDATVVGTGSYADQGRAKVDACNSGLVQIYANRESGAITGAVLLGPAMDHIAHLFAWAIERGETVAGMLELPVYHPTLEEGLKPPLRQICGSVGVDIAHLDSVAPPGA